MCSSSKSMRHQMVSENLREKNWEKQCNLLMLEHVFWTPMLFKVCTLTWVKLWVKNIWLWLSKIVNPSRTDSESQNCFRWGAWSPSKGHSRTIAGPRSHNGGGYRWKEVLFRSVIPHLFGCCFLHKHRGAFKLEVSPLTQQSIIGSRHWF